MTKTAPTFEAKIYIAGNVERIKQICAAFCLEVGLCVTVEPLDFIYTGGPQLKRGMAWCHRCGYSAPVNSAHALRHGWPLHCGETMSIDSPEERRARKK